MYKGHARKTTQRMVGRIVRQFHPERIILSAHTPTGTLGPIPLLLYLMLTPYSAQISTCGRGGHCQAAIYRGDHGPQASSR